MNFCYVFNKKMMALTIVLFFITNTFGAQVSTVVEFPQPQIEKNGNYHSVTLPDAMNTGNPGSPLLPSAGIWLLLPPGEKAVSCRLDNQTWKQIPGKYLVQPAQAPKRLSDEEPYQFIEPDLNIYNSSGSYPTEPISSLNTHLKRGVALATCLVAPVRWNPLNGSIEYLISADLLVETAPGARENEAFSRFYHGDSKTLQWAEKKVRNPRQIVLYPHRDDAEDHAILVITPPDFMDQAEEYAFWRNTKGTQTYIVTVDHLIETEDGIDNQDRIRNGIIRAYEDWGIDYVLLLGDTEFIPHRGMYGIVNNEPDLDVPADLYYAGIDGNWNEDGDENFGEYEEADLLHEVAVGRLAASDVDDVVRMIHKVRLYTDEPVYEDALKVLMLGEELGWEEMGGDYMDEVYDDCERHGYATHGYPEGFERENLYDRDRQQPWNAANQLAPLISDGYHFIHHLGHANTRYSFKFGADELNDNLIRNDGVENGFNIVWSQGCYAGAFDNRTTEVGNYTEDCIAETFTARLANGFVAYFANSRYGWGDGGSTNGASQHFHREFVDAIFDENFTVIGETNNNSKEDVAPWAESGVMLWCYYEITLFGDPAMDMWTDMPMPIEPDYSPLVVIGDTVYTVTLAGIADAVVCLSRDGEIIATGFTDENGVAELSIDEPILPLGEVTLSVVAHDFVPYVDEIQSVSPNHGFPFMQELMLDDNGGIDDGQADPGETIELIPSVRNLGRTALEGLSIRISTEDPFINIIQAETWIDDIEPGNELQPEESIIVEVLAECPDLHQVELTMRFTDFEETQWRQMVIFTTHAAIIENPVLKITNDGGNENGKLDPGEESEIELSLSNQGSGRTANVMAVISCDNPFIEVLEDTTFFDILEPDCFTSAEQSFVVRVAEDCPSPYRAIFYLNISSPSGVRDNLLIDQNIGGAFFDFDRGEEVWEHENLREDDIDQWHLCENDNYSLGGSACLRAGPEAADGEYDGMLNCAAYMPEFEVTGPVNLRFWHKIDAEISRNNPGYAYDGGYVQAMADSGDWVNIYPQTPLGEVYPYAFRRGQSPSPMLQDAPCYSGHDEDWQLALFDLSGFQGSTVQIRFCFGSDAADNYGGWWIDNVELIAPMNIEAPNDLVGDKEIDGAQLIWSTPLIPRDDDPVEENRLLGYRIYRCTDDWYMLDTLVTDRRYFDNLISTPSSEVIYFVTAQYLTGESQPSNFLFLDWANSVGTELDVIPQTWEISSVYPNPFNSVSRIEYSVPVSGNVRISVYNQRGRMVEELVKGINQPGQHTVLFKANTLPSGIYLVRMETPVGVMASKLVLVR